MEGIRKLLVTQETHPWEKNLNPNILIEFLQEKLAFLLHFIASILAYLSDKFDEIFPPETRSETLQRWAHIAVTVVLPVSLAAFMVCFCCKCCCRCLGRRGGGYGRWMKAPGRVGARMPRASFEANPRDYFLNLRAKKPLVY